MKCIAGIKSMERRWKERGRCGVGVGMGGWEKSQITSLKTNIAIIIRTSKQLPYINIYIYYNNVIVLIHDFVINNSPHHDF